jgi:hypothetical protein
MWSAFHLDDGTRGHAVMLPDLPGVAIGYLQTGGEITELTTGSSTFDKPADGRVTHFQRAMAAFTTADGRRGVGWIEWNINQH